MSKQKQNQNDPDYKTNHGRENVFKQENSKVILLALKDTPIPTDNGNKKENNKKKGKSSEKKFQLTKTKRLIRIQQHPAI